MFTDLTKTSYTYYLCSSSFDLHGPAINAYTYPFLYLLHPISLSKHLFVPSIYACKLYNTGLT